MEFKPLKTEISGPFLHQYMGIWAIEESGFGLLWDNVHKMNLASHVMTSSPKVEATTQRSRNLVRVDIRGTMTKEGSSLSEAGSSVKIKQAIRAAARDLTVDGILLVIDSPGGTAAGTAELAAEVASAAKIKPVVAFIEDMAASAAYWVASQASAIYANTSNAWVGSIGTFMALYDYSKMADKEGIRAVVFKTGEYKAAGVAGTEITDNQQVMFQSLVDATQESFTNAIQSSRKLTSQQLKDVLTAKVFPASEAIGVGLIDGIKTYDQSVAELSRMIGQKRRSAMSQQGFGEAVSISEIETACPGASADFVLQQMRSGATPETAAKAFASLLKAELKSVNAKLDDAKSELAKHQEASAKEIAELKSQVETLKASRGTHSAVAEKGVKQTSDAPSAIAQFNEIVSEHMKAGLSKTQAHAKAVRENAELAKQMVAEANHKKN